MRKSSVNDRSSINGGARQHADEDTTKHRNPGPAQLPTGKPDASPPPPTGKSDATRLPTGKPGQTTPSRFEK